MRWLALVVLLQACDVVGPDLTALKFRCETAERCAVDSGVEHDAGADGGVDGGAFDAGAQDAGAFDAGVFDAGMLDAGALDAGPADGGRDGGAADAGAGARDGGCAAGTWCWAGTRQHALRAIAANSPDDFWAVGDLGTIVRYDVQGVREVDSGTLGDLFGVWGSGPSLAWAVGRGGLALQYSGTRWSRATTTTSRTLRAVAGTSSNDVWAVGDDGAIQHFTGVWSSVPSGTTHGLLWVRARTTTDAWAGGFNGTLLHWDGSAWASVSLGTSDAIVSAVLLPPDELFIVTNGGAVHRQTPGGLVAHSQVTLNVRGLHGSSPNDLWAFGMFGEVSHWDGATWSSVSTPLQATWLAAAGYTSFNLVGEGGALIRWDSVNQGFTSLRDVEPTEMTDLLGFADDDLWAVGHGGLVRHWDGTALTTTRLSSRPNLQAIAGLSSNDLWTSGNGVLFRWLGAGWQQYPALPCSVFSMHARAADDVWAVGALGCAMHWDGTAWVPRNGGLPNVTLRSVLTRGPNEVWAVGDSGAAYRYDGTTWSSTNTQTTVSLYALLEVNGDVVAVGGQFATALRYRQGVWSALPSQLQGGFRAGVADGVGGFFGVGTPLDTSSWAPVLRHDGLVFSNDAAPVREALQAAWLSPSGTLWVGGTGGVLLYRPR